MNKQNLKKRSKTNWTRVDAMKDTDIDYSDIPELGDDFFKNAIVQLPQNKVPITIRIDRDVLEWLQSGGPKYQSRINAFLRRCMEAKKKAG